MERPHPNRGIAQQSTYPMLHLLGRFIRKCQSDDRIRRDSLLDQISDTICHHARLAAAGSGEGQQWPVYVLNCCSLRFIESVEDFVHRIGNTSVLRKFVGLGTFALWEPGLWGSGFLERCGFQQHR